MRVPRALGTAALVAGIVIGSAADSPTGRTPIRSGDDMILAGDFHVHAFPGDGTLTPWSLREEAERAGLDVIAVTNHNQFAAPRLIRWLPADPDAPMLIPGEEVTHADYHLIAVGIDRRIAPRSPLTGVIREIQSLGGVAIAAHPGRAFHGYDDDEVLSIVDGIEVARADRREDDRRDYVVAFERARRRHPAVAAIGSSDLHATPGLGDSRTFLFVRERTPAAVLDAIRNGRTVGSNERGELFGDPSLIARVRAAAPAGRTDPHPSWRRLAVALAWFGIAALVVL
jgi:predicted metal-dependent phosphoesterase TrpH